MGRGIKVKVRNPESASEAGKCNDSFVSVPRNIKQMLAPRSATGRAAAATAIAFSWAWSTSLDRRRPIHFDRHSSEAKHYLSPKGRREGERERGRERESEGKGERERGRERERL